MKTLAMKYLGALGLAAVLAMTAVTSTYAKPHDFNCIPQYDTSGAQMALGRRWRRISQLHDNGSPYELGDSG
jgi:hypothetical protein